MAANREDATEEPEQNTPPPVPTSVKGLSRDEAYELGQAAAEGVSEGLPRGLEGRAGPHRRRCSSCSRPRRGGWPELLPLRHGRMAKSAFTFYRGAALTMAADLASSPVSGIRVQCCGDAHLCNFGGFATPERQVIFSINDLDETLPAPWEWDVKRLAASFVVACRDNGLSEAVAKDAVTTAVRTYRESMAEFSRDEDAGAVVLLAGGGRPRGEHQGPGHPQAGPGASAEGAGKEHRRGCLPEAGGTQGGQADHQGPAPDDLPPRGPSAGRDPEGPAATRWPSTARASTPPPGRCWTGTNCTTPPSRWWASAASARSAGCSCSWPAEGDPLFLQVKEARTSVLEPYAGASVFPNHGQRVVNGYRLMQPASDMFLGWSHGPEAALLRPPAEGHQDQRPRGDVRRARDGPLRDLVRAGPGAFARAVGHVRPAQRVHGKERCVRQGDRVVRGRVRGSEREGPRGAEEGHQGGQGRGAVRRREVGRRPRSITGSARSDDGAVEAN